VLIHLVTPHAGKLGFGSQRTDGSRGAAFLSHRFDASSFGFGDKALNRHFGIGGSLGRGLLVQATPVHDVRA
jgi:hypothetical protein